MAVIVILCASCVLPFLHVAVKSISGNTAVMSKSVYFWPKDITFDRSEEHTSELQSQR